MAAAADVFDCPAHFGLIWGVGGMYICYVSKFGRSYRVGLATVMSVGAEYVYVLETRLAVASC